MPQMKVLITVYFSGHSSVVILPIVKRPVCYEIV